MNCSACKRCNSFLRINLKAKIKKRSNDFRRYFTGSINPGELLDQDLNKILEIKFETGSEFQQYFELINNLHTLISATHKHPEHTVEKYLENDAHKEQVIFRFIKEMKDTSLKYNETVGAYNKANPKNKLSSVDPLQFDAIKDIENILNLHPNDLDHELKDDKLDAA